MGVRAIGVRFLTAPGLANIFPRRTKNTRGYAPLWATRLLRCVGGCHNFVIGAALQSDMPAIGRHAAACSRRTLRCNFQPASLSQASRSDSWLFSHCVMERVSYSSNLLFMQVQYFSTTSAAA